MPNSVPTTQICHVKIVFANILEFAHLCLQTNVGRVKLPLVIKVEFQFLSVTWLTECLIVPLWRKCWTQACLLHVWFHRKIKMTRLHSAYIYFTLHKCKDVTRLKVSWSSNQQTLVMIIHTLKPDTNTSKKINIFTLCQLYIKMKMKLKDHNNLESEHTMYNWLPICPVLRAQATLFQRLKSTLLTLLSIQWLHQTLYIKLFEKLD